MHDLQVNFKCWSTNVLCLHDKSNSWKIIKNGLNFCSDSNLKTHPATTRNKYDTIIKNSKRNIYRWIIVSSLRCTAIDSICSSICVCSIVRLVNFHETFQSDTQKPDEKYKVNQGNTNKIVEREESVQLSFWKILVLFSLFIRFNKT